MTARQCDWGMCANPATCIVVVRDRGHGRVIQRRPMCETCADLSERCSSDSTEFRRALPVSGLSGCSAELHDAIRRDPTRWQNETINKRRWKEEGFPEWELAECSHCEIASLTRAVAAQS